MLELMEIGDVIETPKGIVLAGANPKFENVPLPIVMKILKNINIIHYFDRSQTSRESQVLDIQVHSSIGNNFNIFLLLSESDIEKMPENGVVIFCDENDSLNAILNS